MRAEVSAFFYPFLPASNSRIDEVESYEPSHWRRLDIKPGLTGEWQVRGRSSIKDFEEVVRLDIEYQRKWSIFYDLQILFRTIAVVLLRRGAV